MPKKTLDQQPDQSVRHDPVDEERYRKEHAETTDSPRFEGNPRRSTEQRGFPPEGGGPSRRSTQTRR